MSKTRKTRKNTSKGTTFNEFLRKDGVYEAVQAREMKRILVMQLAYSMKARNLTKAEIARRMQSSCAQLERLFDPGQRQCDDCDSVPCCCVGRS